MEFSGGQAAEGEVIGSQMKPGPANTFRGLAENGEPSDSKIQGSHQVYAILIGLFSAIAGVSYCLVRAGAKASDQPVVTVFSFGLLSTPAAAICAFAFEREISLIHSRL